MDGCAEKDQHLMLEPIQCTGIGVLEILQDIQKLNRNVPVPCTANGQIRPDSDRLTARKEEHDD
jgi:hypothetical protein